VTAGSGTLDGPTGVTWGADGNLYVSSFNNNRVLRYKGTTGAFISMFVSPGSGGLNGPDNGTIFGPDGHLYVPSYWNNRILRYHGETGAFLGNFVPSIGRPRVIVFDEGTMYVTSETADAVLSYSAVTGAATGPAVAPGTGGLDLPIGLARGADGDWWVSSGSQNAVYRFDGQSGTFKSIVVPGSCARARVPTSTATVS